MSDGTCEVEAGTQLADAAGRALTEIVAAARAAAGEVDAITVAARRIAVESRRMLDSDAEPAAGPARAPSVHALAAVSEDNAAIAAAAAAAVGQITVAMDGVAATAGELTGVATALDGQVRSFRTA
jgi:methyl-accepting chemotaxis protein